jgi:D-alanyl-D-alanine carboxypeptidase
MITKMKEQINKISEHKELFLTAGIITVLLIVLGGFFIFAQASSNAAETPEPSPVTDAQLATETPAYNPFSDVRISAKAAIVKDLNTGTILYEKNTWEPLPLASLTKVMTALTATEILTEYNKDIVQINWEDLNEGSDSLVAGEHFTVADLLDFVLVSSSNDGASALASVSGGFIATNTAPQSANQAFIARMNTMAQSIGMKDTHFFNETGLDESEINREPGAIGSARDVAELFDYVLDNEPALLDATRADALTVQSKEGYIHHLKNTNEIVNRLPNIIGSKTGFTNTAGGNLAVVIDPGLNQPIVIVVLGSSKDGRFKDVERLTAATLEQLALGN